LSLTTTAPVRERPSGFAATISVIDASPCPLAGLTCTHGASLDALHVHSRAALTVRVTRLPAAGNEEGGADTPV
jgi:hypothetical protein